ncbi:MAG: hypothetical protein R3C45_03875 [Phycisphaerales bacterium]
MKWFFQTHDGFGDIDQSSSAEAFSGHSVRDLATAIVREGIQNSLDAKPADGKAPVRVRLTLGTCAGDPAQVNGRWFGDLIPHLQVEDVGAPNHPAIDEACEYLLFEDFNTKGLIGDYRARYVPGEENNFVNFMYHDGITGKSEQKLGSRGVGKIVFTMASRARVVFACTVRQGDADNRPLLVGKNLLKFRQVGGELYKGRSYFLDRCDKGEPREPVQAAEQIALFRGDFPITRGTESGLSLVIPFIDETITAERLRHAIVSEYHYAILSGRLVVELDNRGEVERFSADHVPEIGDAEVDARVKLTRWAVSCDEPTLVTDAPDAGQPQRLTGSQLPESVRASVEQALNQRTPVAVRLNLHVHPRDADPVPTYFDVFMELSDRHYGRPMFIRELLPVTDVRDAKAAPQVRALVVIEHEPLASLLRAAEGANHTDWSPRTDKFLEKYVGRRGEISFVATSVSQLVDLVRGRADEPVGGIATQFFSAVKDKRDPVTRGQGKGRSGNEPDQMPEIEPTEREESGYDFREIQDGFSIRHRDGRPLPKRITVRVAYDVLRGSPWSQYDPADFDLRKTRSDVRIVSSHAEVKRVEPGNRLVISPLAEGFEVVATGFDPRRDLIIDHRDTDKSRKKRKEDAGDRQTDQLHEPQTADA